MNWLTKLKPVLGKFWTSLFSDKDFTGAIRSALALAGQLKESCMSLLRARQHTGGTAMYNVTLPVPLRLLHRRTDSASGTFKDCVERSAAPLEDVLNGVKELASPDDSQGFAVKADRRLPRLHFITDHVADYTVTLFAGHDFIQHGDGLEFFVDPRTLGLSETRVLDRESGSVSVYLNAFGWRYPEVPVMEAAAEFGPAALASYSGTVWDMHHNGATVYNSKKLLCDVTGSVVCEESGTVSHVWSEQGMQCMKVGSHVYSAPADVSCNFGHGSEVKKGDVIYGDLLFRTGESLADGEAIPYSSVPYITVMTDAGELKAENKDLPALKAGGRNLLPLSGSGSVLAGYRDTCLNNLADPGCPEYTVPDTVNPMAFVAGGMRGGNSVIVSVPQQPGEALQEAVECVRRYAAAGSIISVYMQADGGQADLYISGGGAQAGPAAIPQDTVLLMESSADATTFRT